MARAVVWVVVRDTKRPLVHVELPKEHGARGAEFLHHRRVAIGHSVGEEFGTSRGPHSGRVEEVLERDRHTGQWSTRLAAHDVPLRDARVFHGGIGGDGDERVHLRVDSGDPLETGRGQLDRRHVTVGDALRGADEIERVELT
jgi:hypothetical protein